ncbi:F0F1 ATP synthase subunit B [soil metagenome]
MELLQDAHTWVTVGLLVFIGALIYAKVPGMAVGALDARGKAIQAQLDEAQALRDEANRLLTEVKQQRADAVKLSAELLANAQEDAKRMAIEAKAQLEEQIKRRGELAERKIATAEAQASAEVKAAAADLATQIAESVLTSRLTGLKSDPLIDGAITQMGAKLQ